MPGLAGTCFLRCLAPHFLPEETRGDCSSPTATRVGSDIRSG